MKLPRFRIRGLLIATFCFACLSAFVVGELGDFAPEVEVSLARGSNANNFDLEIRKSSFKPLWVKSAGGNLTRYKLQAFGSKQTDDGRIYEFAAMPEQWFRVGNLDSSSIQVPADTDEFRVGVTVYDWRGRFKDVWSSKIPLTDE